MSLSSQDIAKVYTYTILKRYNIFYYNDTGMIDSDPSSTAHADTCGLLIHPSHAQGHAPQHQPHSPSTMHDNISGSTGHGLLNGKIRKTTATFFHNYDGGIISGSRDSHDIDNAFFKKGR